MSRIEGKSIVRRTRATRTKFAPSGSDQPTRVLHQFRVVFNSLKAHFQQVERAAGIGGSQVWALSILQDNPGIGVNELADALNVRQPTASIIVGKLSSSGLIDVRREGSDRRSVQLHVSAAGRMLLEESPAPHAGLLPSSLKALNPASLEQIEVLLAELISILESRNGRTSVEAGTNSVS